MSITPKIVLDLGGADLGEDELLQGVKLALNAQNGGFELVLVSNHAERTTENAHSIIGSQIDKANLRFVNAAHRLPEQIFSPVQVFKDFPDSTINVGMREIKGNPDSAFISTGNTGLVMTSALFTLQRVKGISRPPIASPLPTLGRTCFFLDAGSNVDCRPAHLHQFAVIGSVYAHKVWGREKPTVGLLSNGSEDYKGNAQVKETHALLAGDKGINYIGYREGNTVFDGDLDILICDGFLGNVMLKFAEGLATAITSLLKQEIRKRPLAGLTAMLFQRAAFKALKRRIDYSEYGGAPLLGVNGNTVICHGRSDRNAIKNAIREALTLARKQCSLGIEEEFASKYTRSGETKED
jgi:phosphate acyltransferase